jgi:hypothetical protein
MGYCLISPLVLRLTSGTCKLIFSLVAMLDVSLAFISTRFENGHQRTKDLVCVRCVALSHSPSLSS